MASIVARQADTIDAAEIGRVYRVSFSVDNQSPLLGKPNNGAADGLHKGTPLVGVLAGEFDREVLRRKRCLAALLSKFVEKSRFDFIRRDQQSVIPTRRVENPKRIDVAT